MKRFDELSKEELNDLIYERVSEEFKVSKNGYAFSVAICSWERGDGKSFFSSIEDFREQVFNVFINRLFSAKGFEMPSDNEMYTDMIKSESQKCLGYLMAYADNVNGVADKINNCETVVDFFDTLWLISQNEVDTCIKKFKKKYGIKASTTDNAKFLFEFDETADLLYKVLPDIEVVAIKIQPISDVLDNIKTFVTEYGLDKSVIDRCPVTTVENLISAVAICTTYKKVTDKLANLDRVGKAIGETDYVSFINLAICDTVRTHFLGNLGIM